MAREPLRIFAAASTIAAVNDAAKLYSKSHEIRVVAVFASSGALARQLAAGAPGHLFLSADPKWMDWAQSQGAINGPSRRVLLGNRLVMAVPKGSGRRFKITKSLDLPALLGRGRLRRSRPRPPGCPCPCGASLDGRVEKGRLPGAAARRRGPNAGAGGAR
jgi:molybdate transport system substrate-binding protein